MQRHFMKFGFFTQKSEDKSSSTNQKAKVESSSTKKKRQKLPVEESAHFSLHKHVTDPSRIDRKSKSKSPNARQQLDNLIKRQNHSRRKSSEGPKNAKPSEKELIFISPSDIVRNRSHERHDEAIRQRSHRGNRRRESSLPANLEAIAHHHHHHRRRSDSIKRDENQENQAKKLLMSTTKISKKKQHHSKEPDEFEFLTKKQIIKLMNQKGSNSQSHRVSNPLNNFLIYENKKPAAEEPKKRRHHHSSKEKSSPRKSNSGSPTRKIIELNEPPAKKGDQKSKEPPPKPPKILEADLVYSREHSKQRRKKSKSSPPDLSSFKSSERGKKRKSHDNSDSLIQDDIGGLKKSIKSREESDVISSCTRRSRSPDRHKRRHKHRHRHYDCKSSSREARKHLEYKTLSIVEIAPEGDLLEMRKKSEAFKKYYSYDVITSEAVHNDYFLGYSDSNRVYTNGSEPSLHGSETTEKPTRKTLLRVKARTHSCPAGGKKPAPQPPTNIVTVVKPVVDVVEKAVKKNYKSKIPILNTNTSRLSAFDVPPPFEGEELKVPPLRIIEVAPVHYSPPPITFRKEPSPQPVKKVAKPPRRGDGELAGTSSEVKSHRSSTPHSRSRSRSPTIAAQEDNNSVTTATTTGMKKMFNYQRSSTRASLTSNQTERDQQSTSGQAQATSLLLTKNYKDNEKLIRWHKRKEYGNCIRRNLSSNRGGNKRPQESPQSPQVVEVRFLTTTTTVDSNSNPSPPAKVERKVHQPRKKVATPVVKSDYKKGQAVLKKISPSPQSCRNEGKQCKKDLQKEEKKVEPCANKKKKKLKFNLPEVVTDKVSDEEKKPEPKTVRPTTSQDANKDAETISLVSKDDLPAHSDGLVELVPVDKFDKLFDKDNDGKLDDALDNILQENFDFLKKDFSLTFLKPPSDVEEDSSTIVTITSNLGSPRDYNQDTSPHQANYEEQVEEEISSWYNFTLASYSQKRQEENKSPPVHHKIMFNQKKCDFKDNFNELYLNDNFDSCCKDKIAFMDNDDGARKTACAHNDENSSPPSNSEESGYCSTRLKSASSFFEKPEIKALFKPPDMPLPPPTCSTINSFTSSNLVNKNNVVSVTISSGTICSSCAFGDQFSSSAVTMPEIVHREQEVGQCKKKKFRFVRAVRKVMALMFKPKKTKSIPVSSEQ